MNRTAYIVIGGAIVIVIAVYFLFRNQNSEPQEITNWEITLDKTDKGPYGLYALFELLETYNPNNEYAEIDSDFLNLDLYDVENQEDIYFFIGHENFYRDRDWEKLEEFVENGNVAFISSRRFAKQLNKELFSFQKLNTEEEYVDVNIYDFSDTTVIFDLKNRDTPGYEMDFIFEDSLEYYFWNYFQDNDYKYINKLGSYNGEKLNFIEIKKGKGRFLLHSTPIAFSNISIFKDKGLQYTESVLSHLPEGNVIWDEVSKAPIVEEEVKEQSPLQFIMKNPPLLWAYLTFIALLLLYLIFRSKRKHPVIPSKEKKVNTSLNFIDVIAHIHFKQNNHRKLVLLKEKTFTHFIRDRYFFSGKFEDPLFKDRLIMKSALEPKYVEELLDYFIQLKKKSTIKDAELIELHNKIEYFYQNCL